MVSPADTQLRHSEVLHRLVLDRDTMEEVGRVDQVLVDVQNHQVEGIVCKTGWLGRDQQTFSWIQIQAMGKDSVLVNPVADHAPHRLDHTRSMIGLEVWSEGGERVGRVVDYRFNPRTGMIVAYGFSPEGVKGLTENIYALLPRHIISMGRKRMMIQEAAIAHPDIFDISWTQKASQAKDAWADSLKDYAQSAKPLETARHSTEVISDQLQAKTRELTTQAKGQLGEVLGRMKKRTRQLRSQLRETVSDVTANLPSGDRFAKDDETVTLDVDSMEVWPDDEGPITPQQESSNPHSG